MLRETFYRSIGRIRAYFGVKNTDADDAVIARPQKKRRRYYYLPNSSKLHRLCAACDLKTRPYTLKLPDRSIAAGELACGYS